MFRTIVEVNGQDCDGPYSNRSSYLLDEIDIVAKIGELAIAANSMTRSYVDGWVELHFTSKTEEGYHNVMLSFREESGGSDDEGSSYLLSN